jgi:predicted  nucleic acid-binding Zn-ribbon protein
MSVQGIEEFQLLNRKLDELLNRYVSLQTEFNDLKNGNLLLKNMLQQRDERIKELEIKYAVTLYSQELNQFSESVPSQHPG